MSKRICKKDKIRVTLCVVSHTAGGGTVSHSEGAVLPAAGGDAVSLAAGMAKVCFQPPHVVRSQSEM